MSARPGRRRLTLALGGIALALGVWALVPSPIDPRPYAPESGVALDGVLAPNVELRSSERIALGRVDGPEDVAVDAGGRLYGGTDDGRIVRVHIGADGTERVETFAETGGRPLGLHFDAAGHLVVADAFAGLLSIAPDGAITVLATEAAGVPFGFTDDLDIASDGRIFFSDASSRFDQHHYLLDLMEARPHGRLLVYHPESGAVEVLLDGLYFANGVALASDESFVLVNETYRYRIRRYWLTGPRAGTDELFVDRLPGFPDGVASDRAGTFWVALFTVRNPLIDRLHRSAWAKSMLAKLPRALWPRPEPYGLAVALDEQGRYLRSLHDPGGAHVSPLTSVEPMGQDLYLGTLEGDWIGRYSLR